MPDHEIREAWVSIAPDEDPPSPAPGRYSFEFRPAPLDAYDRTAPAFSTLYTEIMRGAGHLSAAIAAAAQDCYY